MAGIPCVVCAGMICTMEETAVASTLMLVHISCAGSLAGCASAARFLLGEDQRPAGQWQERTLALL